MARFAPWFGILGGAAWIALGFVPPECVPASDTSEVFCNRLWTPPLAAMFVSSLAVFRSLRPTLGRLERIGLGAVAIGFGLMVIGNGGEYWLAYQLPHQGPMGYVRGFLWMGVLCGWLAALVGSTMLGIALLKDRVSSRRLGLPFALAVPLTVGFATLAVPALPIGIVGLSVGGLGLAARRRR